MKKILVIDDEPQVVQMISSRLKANEYEVVTAGDGDDGLQVAAREKPDLIILDIMMPRMDGYSFIRELRSSGAYKQVPVIVLTAKGHLKELFDLEGVQDYVTKPFSAKDLLARIEQYLVSIPPR